MVHTGTIVGIGPSTVKVRIDSSADECGKCAIASLCSKAEVLELPYAHPDQHLVGQRISISISAGSQRRAIVLFLAIPVVLICLAMAIGLMAGTTQTVAGLIAIGAVAVWYAAIFITKNREKAKIEIIK